ncbi:MAG TPA: branched-chain amino acid ABC transporter permease/ATP-binding protein [Solirubrobacteraceae bacterium]|nr:branched-chain amino acid ABC transporter permease/ATP-binding protein [Solirubrobacteraceae bacterium]
MTDFLRFAVLGVGLGAIYALAGQGLVLVYRGSGVLNIAQGGFGAAGAYVFYDLTQNAGWDNWTSALVVIAGVAAAGALIHVLVMQRLASAAPLVKLIASLGLFVAIEQAVALRYGSDVLISPPILPQTSVQLISGVRIGADRLIILAIAVAASAILSLWLRYARLGLAVSAIADDHVGAAALGWSPLRLGALTWGIGAALGAGAGILIAPITALDPTTVSFVVVPALASALVGGFRSFWWTLLGGLVIGIGQSLASFYISAPGWTTAVPFLVVLLMLLLRGRALPGRGDVLERLPRVGSGQVAPRAIAGCALAALVAIALLPPVWTDAISTSLEFALVLASLVVVTGFAGQLSLAQIALAGVGALIAGRLAAAGIPYELAIVAAAAGCLAVGAAVGAVALRTRGASLAIATLALGLIIQGLVLQSVTLTGGQVGIDTGRIRLFGVDVYSVSHSQRYAAVLLVVVALVCTALAGLRRGRVGMRLLAVRGNERAAATLGVNVTGAKLYAFALSAGLAGLAGSFFAFRTSLLTFEQFSVQQSLNVVALVVIGGVGYVSGSIVGGLLATGGVVAVAASQWFGADISAALVIASGLTVVLLVMIHPDGVAALADRRARRSQVAEAARPERPLPAPRRLGRAPGRPAPLVVRDLNVSFGGVRALAGVDLEVATGAVVGLIGPNGAGKTTLIDAVSGLVPYRAGELRLGSGSLTGLPPHRRARLGLSRTFQAVELFDDLTIKENLLVAALPPRPRDWLGAGVARRTEPLSEDALAVAETLGLAGELDALPRELPLAKRRLAAVARSVVRWPSVLMLDEPASGLTREESDALGALLRRIASDCGVGILLVEHDVEMVMSHADRVVAIDFGAKIADGPPQDVRANPAVRRAYLGDAAPAPALGQVST